MRLPVTGKLKRRRRGPGQSWLANEQLVRVLKPAARNTYVIGDIHGCLNALKDLLDQLKGHVREEDTVVFLGDYIDRGPDSKGCVDRILHFQSTILAEVVTLMGNHEQWFLETMSDYCRHSWLLGMSGLTTVRSYSEDAWRTIRRSLADLGPSVINGNVALPYELFFETLPQSHLDFFTGLIPYHRDYHGVYAHGGLDPSAGPVEEQLADTLLWGGSNFPKDYDGADTVVYGHWNNPEFYESGTPRPRRVNGTIGINMIHYGVLCAVRLPDMKCFQGQGQQTP